MEFWDDEVQCVDCVLDVFDDGWFDFVGKCCIDQFFGGVVEIVVVVEEFEEVEQGVFCNVFIVVVIVEFEGVVVGVVDDECVVDDFIVGECQV